jgi:hypothetical protein
MKITHIVWILLLVVLSNCPTQAEDAYSGVQISGQSAPYGSSSAASQSLIRGPSSSDVRARPAANSTVNTPATNPPAVYPPTAYPPAVYPPTAYPPTAYPPPTYPPVSTGQQYQNLSGQANAVSVQPDITMPALGNRLIESTWYTRVDYFHWNEHQDGMNAVNEYGTLFTLGYMRRVGIERFHAALFGATMRYKGFSQYVDDDNNLIEEPLTSATGYLGALAEYDLHIEPDSWPTLSLFVGIGTRFWIRDLKDGTSDYGSPVIGYQENWWTIYPYLGLEKKRSPNGGFEFYYAGRIGVTAMTYQYATWGGVALYPKPGLTGQLECGIRGRCAFVSIFTEVLSWRESDVVEDMFQPNSQMFTIGLKTGFSF